MRFMFKLHGALCDLTLSRNHEEQILKAREAEHSSMLEYLRFFLQPTNYGALRWGGGVAAIHKYTDKIWLD